MGEGLHQEPQWERVNIPGDGTDFRVFTSPITHLLSQLGCSSVMGVPCKCYLPETRLYACGNCSTHLARCTDLLSDGFRGSTGDACLFDVAINVSRQPPEDTLMTSGKFTVQYIHCKYCDEYLGWTYVRALSASQIYKEGKFILENSAVRTITYT